MSRNQSKVDPGGRELVAQPGAPGVAAGAAGERGAAGHGACRGQRDVGGRAPEVGHEVVGVGQAVDAALADHVDERLSQAERAHAR